MNSKNWNDYLEAIHASKPRWNRPVTLEEVIQRQRKLNQSLGFGWKNEIFCAECVK